KYRQNRKTEKEGGMLNKYSFLITFIMSSNDDAKIKRLTLDSVLIQTSTIYVTTSYLIVQAFNKVTVTWRIESQIFGSHKLQWSFDEYLDQEVMCSKIVNDVGKYQTNVLTGQVGRNDLLG